MISRPILMLLVTFAVVLPVTIVVLVVMARLLSAMQDAAAANVLDRIALAAGVLWAIELVCLLLALAIDRLDPPPPKRSHDDES